MGSFLCKWDSVYLNQFFIFAIIILKLKKQTFLNIFIPALQTILFFLTYLRAILKLVETSFVITFHELYLSEY